MVISCRRHADHAFLCGRRDEAAVGGKDHAARQPARALRGRAVAGIQQPFVDAERAVEPHRVIEAGDLHIALQERDAVRQHRRADQIEIRCVGEHRAVQRRRIADARRPDETRRSAQAGAFPASIRRADRRNATRTGRCGRTSAAAWPAAWRVPRAAAVCAAAGLRPAAHPASASDARRRVRRSGTKPCS